MVLRPDQVSQVTQVHFIEDTSFAEATLVLKFIKDDAVEVQLVE